MTVAVSLTIATADTFKVAEFQYENGYMDARALQDRVEHGMELKIVRVISDTFLWLAQAQTLIRLFPRQREKIIIKWTAFALITLDVLFSILNNFVYDGASRPRFGHGAALQEMETEGSAVSRDSDFDRTQRCAVQRAVIRVRDGVGH